MKTDIIEVAKRRGFFWRSSEIYQGIAGFYDYGPMGSLLKRRFENLWRGYFLGLNDNFYEIEPSLIMPENVFVASGHLKSFVDPVAKCTKCGHAERADHILEDVLKESFEGIRPEEMMAVIKNHGIKCGKCKGAFSEVGTLNMMFPLSVGTGNDAKKAYLTPETAQGAYVNFKACFEVMRRRLPLGLAIIGKAFRNEISPRQGLIRMREFTQAELQIFFDPDRINEHDGFESVKDYNLRLCPVKNREKQKAEDVSCKNALSFGLPKFYVYNMAKVQQFYLDLLKLPMEKFRFRELSEEERAFYNKYHWDIEMLLESTGWKEIAGLHYRTDHDLSGHEKTSKTSMHVNMEGKDVLPHVLEISMGIDRNIYMLLDMFYDEEKERAVIRFPRLLSPMDAGVFPLVNKGGLEEKAMEIKRLLDSAGFRTFFDVSGSIGRRYRRIDEIGVPAGITIDYDTLKDNTVTLRDRDTMKQVRVNIRDISTTMKLFLEGEDMEKLGEKILPAKAD